MNKIDEKILSLALMFAEVHVGDGDVLGDLARHLEKMIKEKYPDIEPCFDLEVD